MSGMQQLHTSPIGRLFSAQAGVATFRQLTGRGVSIHHVRAQVSAGRWRRFGEHCIVSHNFEPTRLQMMWIVSLDQPGLVAMAGLTALETAGFKFFGRELELIHFVVPRGAKSRSFPGTYRHESRRFFEGDVDGASPLPRTGMPRSAIDAAAWQPYHAMPAASSQPPCSNVSARPQSWLRRCRAWVECATRPTCAWPSRTSLVGRRR